MKRNIMMMLAFALAIGAQAKWTLVPRYTSYISISEQGDTIDARSSRTTLYKDDSLGMFRVAIIHETLTKQRIKYIRRMETREALTTLSASLSAISAFSGDWRQRYRGRLLTYIDASLADIYDHNASAARKLDIEAWIENTCQEEIMLADQEHGRVWFLQPGQTLRFTMSNPGIIMIRASTIDQSRRHFITVAAGSMMRDAQVEMETDNEYIFPQKEADGSGFYDTTGYFVVDKLTSDKRHITKEEYKQFRKAHK